MLAGLLGMLKQLASAGHHIPGGVDTRGVQREQRQAEARVCDAWPCYNPLKVLL
jgi:hypothetical protein